MSTMIAERIRQARLAAGLTLNEAAQHMTDLGQPITGAALSKYEHGMSMPRAQTLLTLAQALNVKSAYFLTEPQVQITWLAFRKHASLGQRRQVQARAVAQRVIEGQAWLETLLYPNARPQMPPVRYARTFADVEAAAAALRAAWEVGSAPIESVIQAAEDHGCIVVGWRGATDGFDALSGWTTIGEERAPTALINLRMPDDRRRFDLAHELGHLSLFPDVDVDEKTEERFAHRFASAFLVPAEAARNELGERRKRLALEELGILKAKYGLSMQAWARRARDLGIIEEGYYSHWCKEFASSGWRKEEPYPFVGQEEPLRLRQMTLRAYAEGIITEERARELCPEAVTPQLVLRPEGQRYTARNLMRMPREERNRILAAAAHEAEEEYIANPELAEFEAFGKDDLYDEYPD